MLLFLQYEVSIGYLTQIEGDLLHDLGQDYKFSYSNYI